MRHETSQNIHEVEVLVRDRGFNVLIAHLERFIWIPGNKKGIRSLLEIPVRIQINSEGLQDWRHRRYLLKMFRPEVHMSSEVIVTVHIIVYRIF